MTTVSIVKKANSHWNPGFFKSVSPASGHIKSASRWKQFKFWGNLIHRYFMNKYE